MIIINIIFFFIIIIVIIQSSLFKNPSRSLFLPQADSPVFDRWAGFPNGEGVLRSSALPNVALRNRIGSSKPGVYWLEAPPSMGKTSLGQILSRHDCFVYMNMQSGRLDGTVIAAHDKIFVDEAHELQLADLR
eukprot:6469108-Amphidinium_carterae.1